MSPFIGQSCSNAKLYSKETNFSAYLWRFLLIVAGKMWELVLLNWF